MFRPVTLATLTANILRSYLYASFLTEPIHDALRDFRVVC
jgi:hypothetical protein